jgi:hypothetical protein
MTIYLVDRAREATLFARVGAGVGGASLRAMCSTSVITMPAVRTAKNVNIRNPEAPMLEPLMAYFMSTLRRIGPFNVTEIAWRFSPNCG